MECLDFTVFGVKIVKQFHHFDEFIPSKQKSKMRFLAFFKAEIAFFFCRRAPPRLSKLPLILINNTLTSLSSFFNNRLNSTGSVLILTI